MLESAQTPRQLSYRGRFAPSPSGPLHFGSLLAAVASYLDARAHQGQWLVRIEDIDPPREVAGASDEILRALEAFGLHWDESVRYQSQRLKEFQCVIDELVANGAAYHCDCTRKRIKSIGGLYDGHCRDRQWRNNELEANATAIRFQFQPAIDGFKDLRLGWQSSPAPQDFVIKRRDGLIAYQLAVVLDDIDQTISHVVRGIDLLETTPCQLALYRQFQHQPPAYLHLPLALDSNGNKLSKQNHAPAINQKKPQTELFLALQCLNLQPPQSLQGAPVCDQLSWAVAHWQRNKLGSSNSISIETN